MITSGAEARGVTSGAEPRAAALRLLVEAVVGTHPTPPPPLRIFPVRLPLPLPLPLALTRRDEAMHEYQREIDAYDRAQVRARVRVRVRTSARVRVAGRRALPHARDCSVTF